MGLFAAGNMQGGRRQQGAVVLLLLLVLVLAAGSVLMSGAADVRHRLLAAKERKSLVALGQAKAALLGYAIAQGRLPRPARSATDGREAEQPCVSEQDCTGFLPWVDLGVGGADGWDNRLRYSVTAAYTKAPLDFRAAVANKTVLSRRGDSVYYVAGNPQCEVSAQCVPAVLWSTGRANFGVSVQGIAQAGVSERDGDERHNAGATSDFMQRPLSSAADQAGGDFDDLVTWLPLLPLVSGVTANQPAPPPPN